MASEDTRARITRVSCYAVVTSGDCILLCRLRQWSPGEWTLPGGGIDYGEHPERAVAREVLEETGLRVEPDRVLRVDAQLFENPESWVHVIRIFYRARFIGGQLKNEEDGSTDLSEWVKVEDAKRLPLVYTARMGLELLAC